MIETILSEVMDASVTNAQKDAVLESFITLVRNDSDLQSQVKSALNQDQVIDIAASLGYSFDSTTILRKWSKHTDFSQDTWMGWFGE